ILGCRSRATSSSPSPSTRSRTPRQRRSSSCSGGGSGCSRAHASSTSRRVRAALRSSSRTFEGSVEGVEISPDVHGIAVERAATGGLSHLVSFRLADASQESLEHEAYDAALCLGASFVYGGLAGTIAALEPAVRPGGHVVVGEPYWRRLPLPDDYEERRDPWTTLDGTVTIFETSGLPVVSVIASSEDDWDRYETLRWQSVERWLDENPDD